MKKGKLFRTACTCLLVIGFAFMALASSSSSSESDTSIPPKTGNEQSDVAGNDEKGTEAVVEEEYCFEVADSNKDLSIGQISKNGKFYVGLSCVRSLDEITTAVGDYSEKIESSQEAIYPIIQIYNGSGNVENFMPSDIAIYVDSVQAAEPDTIYLLGIDDLEAFNSYELDPGKTATVITAGIVEEGWSEMTIFCGDVSWKVTPEEINSDFYSYSSLFGLEPDYQFTEVGSMVYSGDYEVIFDGFEIFSQDNIITGTESYAIFEFTVNNTSDDSLDYSLVGYNMRGYCNADLLDGASYVVDDTINGYTNVYDVDEIHAGMSSKIYIAFPTISDTGVFECNYDVGYITNESLGMVCFEK